MDNNYDNWMTMTIFDDVHVEEIDVGGVGIGMGTLGHPGRV